MLRYVLAASILAGSVVPVLAAEYFIVRGPDKACKVVEVRPTDKTVVVIGDKAYVTRERPPSRSRLSARTRCKQTAPFYCVRTPLSARGRGSLLLCPQPAPEAPAPVIWEWKHHQPR